MVLVLVLHRLEAVTATVPMCVILLKNLNTNQQIPELFRLRQVALTSTEISTSLWDVMDLTLFEEWLHESLGPGVTHSLHPVLEEYSIGLMSQVGQARTKEKAKQQFLSLQSSTRSAVAKAGTQLTDFDKKYGISENTSQTFKKMSAAATQAKGRAMENATIAKVSTNVNAGLKSVGRGFEWARERLTETISGGTSVASMPPVETGPSQATPPQVVMTQPASSSQSDRAVFDLGEEDEKS